MNFEWRMERDKELTFEDRVHNLACFEIVLNILRMKAKAGDDDIKDEIQALCGFALECMFKGKELEEDDDLFDRIMHLKNKNVHTFRTGVLKQMGVPEEVASANEIGEA